MIKDLYGGLYIWYDKCMLKKQTLQSGGAALIIILVLTIILAGGLGYTWWQNSAKVKPLVNTSTTSTQNDVVRDNNTDSITSHDESYLVIEEWGVRLKTSVSEHLTYEPYSRTDARSPMEYDILGLKIKPTSVTDQYCVNFGADLYRQRTPSDFESKKIGDYYYYVTGAPGVCSEEPSDIQLQQSVLIDLNIANLEAM